MPGAEVPFPAIAPADARPGDRVQGATEPLPGGWTFGTRALLRWPPRPRDPLALVAMVALIAVGAWHTALPLYCYEEIATGMAWNQAFAFRYMRTNVVVVRGDLFCPRGTEATPGAKPPPCDGPGRAPWPAFFGGGEPYSVIVSVPSRATDAGKAGVGHTLLAASRPPADCGAATSPAAAPTTAWDCVQYPGVLGAAQAIDIPVQGRGPQLAASPGLHEVFAVPMYEGDAMATDAHARQERVTQGLVDALDQAARRGRAGLAMPLLGTGNLRLEPYASIDASLDAVVRHADRRNQPTLRHVVIVAHQAEPGNSDKALDRVRQKAAGLRADHERRDYLPERKLAWLVLLLNVIGIVVVPVLVRVRSERAPPRALPGDRWYGFIAYLLLYGNVLNVVNDLLDNLFLAAFWPKVVVLGSVALSPIALHAVLRHMPAVGFTQGATTSKS